jgi:hypothetical protein
LQFLLSVLVYPAQVERALEGAIRSGTRLVVFGLAGLLLNRVSPPGTGRDLDAVHDEIRDFARFVVASVALVLFALGLGRALRLVCADVVLIFGNLPQVLAGPREAIMSAWVPPVAGVLSGGIFSAVIWQSEYRRRFACTIRAFFLSLVIIITAAITLLGSVWVAAELLRGLLGYRAIFDTWSFMRDWLPVALVGELLWIVHWVLLRQQAEFRPDGSSVDAGGIPWPRRPVLAALTFLGLVTMASALASLLWLWLDGVFHTGIALVGNNWWQERLSFGLAAAVVGGVLWIGTWRYLERAFATGAMEERRSIARRFLLGFVALAASLIAVGFFVAMLWIAFRSLLGEALTPGTVSLAFKELSIVVLAMMVALYYGIKLRGDVLQTRGMAERTLALMVLADTGTAAEQLAMLQRQRAVRVTAVGRLKADTPVAVFDAAALPQVLAALGQEQQDEQALVVLQGGRVTLYRFYP